MFRSFFPRPAWFFGSFVIWALATLLLWHKFGLALGVYLSAGEWFGLVALDPVAVASTEDAKQHAVTFWTYQFVIGCYLLFVAFWFFVSKHKWRGWSIAGTAGIMFFTWYMVQLDVLINDWFGTFYDMIQSMFAKPGSIPVEAYYDQLTTFFAIAGVFVLVRVLGSFFIQHYNFRWRSAMNEYYAERWAKIRQIEGAGQRVQDDTMRFADIMEGLGTGFLDAVMTLIAFMPILWMLSEKFISTIPVFGPIAHGLVIVSALWSVLGTLVLALAGYYLPTLEFHNQRVESNYRSELVFGERDTKRAQPPTLRDLFGDVRKNYFRMYFHYVYFNAVRFSYLQASVLIPYFALAPTLASPVALAAGFTLGVMQQIIRAFDRVQSSFQFLVQNWSTIIKLVSIYKRLDSLDRAIDGLPLASIDEKPGVA